MNTLVYDKTDKGREEIATRKYHMAPRLRSLLVMIDGHLAHDTLLKNVAGLGVTEENIDELLIQDYITVVGGMPVAAPVLVPARAHHGVKPRPRVPGPGAAAAAALRADPADPVNVADLAEPAEAAQALPRAAPAPSPQQGAAAAQQAAQDEAERFRHLYDFYNQTIKSTIGLRGIMLQLKVEKCGNVEDFRELRQPYLEAVLKAKGSEMAHSMRGRLDQLLGGRPAPDPFVLPGD